MGFCRFMATGVGRGARVLAGLALIAWGLLGIGGTGGVILAAVGLLPLAAGLVNFCMVAPLLGCSFSGRDVQSTR